MVIGATLPFVLKWLWEADLGTPPGAPLASIAWPQLALTVFCGLAGWQSAKRMGIFGAAILGPLILAAGSAFAGVLQHHPPTVAIWATLFFTKMSFGAKCWGITMREVRTDVTCIGVLCCCCSWSCLRKPFTAQDRAR